MFCPTVQQVNIYILAFFAFDIVPFQEVFYLTFLNGLEMKSLKLDLLTVFFIFYRFFFNP